MPVTCTSKSVLQNLHFKTPPALLNVLLLPLRDIRDKLETAAVEMRFADERLAALWENCKAAKVRALRI